MTRWHKWFWYIFCWGWHVWWWVFAYGFVEFGVMKPESLVKSEDGFGFQLFFLLLPSTIFMLVFSYFAYRGKYKVISMIIACVPFIHIFILRVYYISEYGMNLCGKQSLLPLRTEYFSSCF